MTPTDRDDLLSDLTEPQQEAVTSIDGPMLILAGAGSGKTRVITRRTAWMIRQGIRASKILAITFTNKAAGEMQARVNALVPGNRIWISTFHSMGARLMRQYADKIGIDRNFTILDMDDRNKAIKLCLDAADLDSTKFTPDRIGGAISKAKNQLLTPEAYEAKAFDFFTRAAAAVYHRYHRKLKTTNCVDFDDLLYVPAFAMRFNAELRDEWGERFRYVMIDEYQDTNLAQYEIAKMLSAKHRNLCVVGDPDQSIYKWRGSDIRNILDFEKDFPDARIVTLDKNYRSTPAILRAASALIERNRERKKKGLFTDNPEGEPVRVIVHDTGLTEAEGIARRIRKAVDSGTAEYKDHAVFVRMNALTRSLESAFVKVGVPFQIVKGLAFFDRKENKDVLAYLKLLINPTDDISFLRVVNEPARGLGKVTLDRLQAYATEKQISLLEACTEVSRIPEIKGKAAVGLAEFARLIRVLRGGLELPPDELIRQVLDKTGYREMLRKSKDDEDVDRLANVEEMITSAKQFQGEEEGATTRDFLERITLAGDIDNWDENQDRVSVMTLHAAKGLEFPIVYMPAVEQGILPGERSMNSREDIEEERRVCFVGMTRAMKELVLSRAVVREFRGQLLYTIPSLFLEELPEEVSREEQLSHGGRSVSADQWRGGNAAADEAWRDTGRTPRAGGGRPRTDVSSRELPRSAAPTTTTSTSTLRAAETISGKPTGALPVAPELLQAGSSFDADPETTEYEPGMLVQHETFGIGRVTSISGLGSLRKLKIQFASGGERTFVLAFAKLRVIKRK